MINYRLNTLKTTTYLKKYILTFEYYVETVHKYSFRGIMGIKKEPEINRALLKVLFIKIILQSEGSLLPVLGLLKFDRNIRKQ
jgi:hypothetical protein